MFFEAKSKYRFYRLYRLFSEKYRLLFQIKVFIGFYRFIGFTLMPAFVVLNQGDSPESVQKKIVNIGWILDTKENDFNDYHN